MGGKFVDYPNGNLAYCEGKQSFETPGLAHQIQRRRQKKGKIADVYRCPSCGHFHIGSPILPKREKKRPC